MYFRCMYIYLYHLPKNLLIMKLNRITQSIMILLVAITMVACGGSSKKAAEETASAEPEVVETKASGTFTVDNDASVVAWKGEVAGVYGHNGVIDIKDGSLTVSDGMLTAGSITIDMTTIQPLDTASYEASGKTPQDLVDHLTTGDFFLVEEFPDASFVVKSHSGNTLTGDLTIRGNTNEETVELSSFEASADGVKGEGILVFDRQKYDVNWEHYIEDYVLSNDIELTLSIVAGQGAM